MNNSFRKTAMSIIFVLSLILNFLLYRPINSLINILCSKVNFFDNFVDELDKIGIGINIFTLSASFALLYFLFDHYLWKTKCIQKFHKVPNLNGKWNGCLKSSFPDESGNSIIMDAYLTIEQTWTKITIKCNFVKRGNINNKDVSLVLSEKSSSSYSRTATFDVNNLEGPKLVFTYENNSNDPSLNIRSHIGCNSLVYKDDTLQGIYFTNRGDGTHGTLFLSRMKDICETIN